MKTASLVAVLLIAMIVPTAAAEPPTGEPHDPAAPLPHHADADGDRISDRLQALLEEADPASRTDVVVILTDQATAERTTVTLPKQALRRRHRLIPAFSATLNSGQIRSLANQPGVLRIEETFTVSVANDGGNADFGAAVARDTYAVDGTGIGICVIDTGIDTTHEQFDDAGKVVGWIDLISGNPDPYDDHGHGTHVAGTAAGSGTGGADAAKYGGVAPGASLFIAKALDAGGFSVADSVAEGVEWCVDQAGVDIISMSLGDDAPSDGLDSLSLTFNAAVDAGKIVVVAAGNDGDDLGSVSSPAAAEKAITVGAVTSWSLPVAAPNHDDGVYLASFSSRGPTLAPTSFTKPDVSAPGVQVMSAEAGTVSGYSMKRGTSMATPFVAGTVALMLEPDSALTYGGITGIIATTSIDRGPGRQGQRLGLGAPRRFLCGERSRRRDHV